MVEDKVYTYTITFPTETAKQKFIKELHRAKNNIEKKNGFKRSVPEVLLEALELLNKKLENDKV